MTADIVVTDGTNAMTLNVETWDFDITRAPKEFSMGSLPSMGAPFVIATDFGSYMETLSLSGWLGTRTLAKNLQDWAEDEWFVNQPLSITIPALAGDDDAFEVVPSGSNTEPILMYCRVWEDLEQMGPGEFRFEIRFALARRL